MPRPPRPSPPLLLSLLLAFTAASPARADDAPNDLLRAKGLTRVGINYFLDDDVQLAETIKSLRAAQAVYDDAKRKRAAAEQAFDNYWRVVTDMVRENERLNAQLKDTPKSSADYDALLDRSKTVRRNLRDAVPILDRLQHDLAAIHDPTDDYVETVQRTAALMASLESKYAKLADDEKVTSALAALSQPGKAKYRLGPSERFRQEYPAVKKLLESVATVTIKLDFVGGVPSTEVTLNDTLKVPVIVDSGAALVSLSAETAQRLGLRPGPDDPVLTMKTADGKTHETHLMTLKSVKLGPFTARDVPCSVLPPDIKGADNLLGGSFLSRFVYRMDLAARELRLTRVAKPGAATAPTSRPAGPVFATSQPATPGPVAIVPPAPTPPLTPTPPVPSAPRTAQTTQPASRNVLLFRTRDDDEKLLRLVAAGGKLRLVSKSEGPSVLADPQAFANVDVIAFGPNRWRDTKATDVTDAVQQSLQRFVRDGGDLVMFEQYGQGNMAIIDALFGLKTRGGAKGATVTFPALDQRLNATGYPAATLDEVRFYNAYDALPEGSTVFAKAAGNRNGAVLVPFGKGRLILIGTGIDPSDQPVDQAILELVYGVTSPVSAPPRPARPSEAPAPGLRRVLLLAGNKREEELLRPVASGSLTVAAKSEGLSALANLPARRDHDVIFFGTNRLRETPAAELSDALAQSLRQFTLDGGDIIVLEQFAHDHMKFIDAQFGTKTENDAARVTYVHPDLQPRLAAAALSDPALERVHFFNSYPRLPEGSVPLLQCGKVPVAAIVPAGRGRLVLIGLTSDPGDHQKIVQAVLDLLYHDKPQPTATAPPTAAPATRKPGGSTLFQDPP